MKSSGLDMNVRDSSENNVLQRRIKLPVKVYNYSRYVSSSHTDANLEGYIIVLCNYKLNKTVYEI